MADSDQILQLGIEEARNGNRDEARNLFELLTRQEPNNAQAWLWLAGVADNPDQRRAALQRVLELDPDNDMARKGLQAMGVATAAAPAAEVVTDADVAPSPVAPVVPVAPVEPDRPRSLDEEFADQLDSAFDDYDALPRAEAPRREETIDDAASGARVTTERPAVRSSRLEFDDDDEEPVRRGPHPLLWVLLALIGAVLLGFLVLSFLGGNGGTAGRPTNEPGAVPTSATGEQPTLAPGTGEQPTSATGEQPTLAPGTGEQPTSATGEQPTLAPGTGEQPTAATGEQPTAAPGTGEQPTAAAPSTPPEQANPAPAGVGTTVEGGGWSYTFPNASYAVYLGNQAGGQTAQGEFVHVLVNIANNTGTAQPVPADFFVLKDSQGRVFSAKPQVSSALVQRGINADLGMEDPVPANGTITSVYLVFDVAPDATGLVLFSRANTGQGWPVNPVR
jgi:hypothetical protein